MDAQEVGGRLDKLAPKEIGLLPLRREMGEGGERVRLQGKPFRRYFIPDIEVLRLGNDEVTHFKKSMACTQPKCSASLVA